MSCRCRELILVGLTVASLAGAFSSGASASSGGDEVVVVYNSRLRESRTVADHYARLRQVPASQILGLSLPETESITREEFREKLQKPLFQFLDKKDLFVFQPEKRRGDEPRTLVRSRVRYAVLCYGVPLKIAADPSLIEAGAETLDARLRRNDAAVDSELYWLPQLERPPRLAGPLQNPFYGATNAALLHPTNGVLMIARLDGPSAAIARGLVDKAMEAETNGLWGRAYVDLRGLTNGEYKLGDDILRGTAEFCRRYGFETVVDDLPGTFPVAFPMSHVGFYAGWYDGDVSGPFSQPQVEFMPGAFAYHLHSFSAATIRSTNQHWVGPLLARGATVSMGCVEEPYLSGSPDIANFASRWMFLGFSFGEAAWAGQAAVSWQTTVLGDPLFRPFGRRPQELHEDLQRRKRPEIEWSHLRVVNLSLVQSGLPEQLAAYLEQVPETAASAVLTEKLADLYQAAGKPGSAMELDQRALKLNPSRQQRTRLTFTLAQRLTEAARGLEAYELLESFHRQCADYPDPAGLLRVLTDRARTLHRTSEAEAYARQLDRLTSLAPSSTNR